MNKKYRYVYGRSVDNYGIIQTKEVKKVKYLEVKVVKVKKDKSKLGWTGTSYRELEKRVERGKQAKQELIIREKRGKGNWVNGENLDKIKFPCYCIFDSNKGINGSGSGQCVKGIGRIDKTWDDIAYKDRYQITKITNQSKDISVLYENYSLKKLMMNLNIHILKAKIIIYEEE